MNPDGRDPERQPQRRDRARALRPVRLRPGQRVEMILVGKARDGMIRLRLQVGREDPSLRLGAQLRHPPPVDQVRHQRGDEHGLARAAEPGDPEPDHRIAEHPADLAHGLLDAAGHAAGQAHQVQGRVPPSRRRCRPNPSTPQPQRRPACEAPAAALGPRPCPATPSGSNMTAAPSPAGSGRRRIPASRPRWRPPPAASRPRCPFASPAPAAPTPASTPPARSRISTSPAPGTPRASARR